MKRILLSIMTLGVVVGVGAYMTQAYFTDTEVSQDNIIQAGTIDISVDGENPWIQTYTIDDIKPSYVRFIEFTAKNEGSNPLNLYKHIKDIVTADGDQSEPECTDQGGIWVNPAGPCDYVTENNNNIDTVIEYDMYIGGPSMEVVWDDAEETTGHVEGYDSVIIHEDDGMTLDDIESHYIWLTQLGSDESVKVIQSYHMATDTENWAQGDTLTFDIELLALQLNALGPDTTTVLLNNKDGSWNEVYGDGVWGMLSYTTVGSTFDYDFEARGLTPGTSYSLVYVPDPWPQGLSGGEVTEIYSGVADGSGNISVSSGSVDLGYDMPHPDDTNYPDGAKIWLVLDADHDGTEMTGWNPTSYLFEHNFVKYDDTDF